MVDVVSGSHHHLKGRDHLTAGRAAPRHPEKPAGERQRQAGGAQSAGAKPETKVRMHEPAVGLVKKRLAGKLEELSVNDGSTELTNPPVVKLN